MNYIKGYNESNNYNIIEYINLVFSDDVDEGKVEITGGDDLINIFTKQQIYRKKYFRYNNNIDDYKDLIKLNDLEKNLLLDNKASIDRIMEEYGDKLDFLFWYTESGSLCMQFEVKSRKSNKEDYPY